MNETELELCPFCGGEGKLVENHVSGGKDYSFVKCVVCEAKTANYYVSLKHCPNDEATKAWNRRADNEQRAD
jgi:hypothetical protein